MGGICSMGVLWAWECECVLMRLRVCTRSLLAKQWGADLWGGVVGRGHSLLP